MKTLASIVTVLALAAGCGARQEQGTLPTTPYVSQASSQAGYCEGYPDSPFKIESPTVLINYIKDHGNRRKVEFDEGGHLEEYTLRTTVDGKPHTLMLTKYFHAHCDKSENPESDKNYLDMAGTDKTGSIYSAGFARDYAQGKHVLLIAKMGGQRYDRLCSLEVMQQMERDIAGLLKEIEQALVKQ